MDSTRAGSASADGSLNRDVSTAMVALYKDYMGRGPTKAQTTINHNLVVCVLRDAMTKGERKLADTNRGDVVVKIRHTFQQTMRDDAVAAVERLTGRHVIAFLSDHDPGPDVAVEVFVLAPLSEDGDVAATVPAIAAG